MPELLDNVTFQYKVPDDEKAFKVRAIKAGKTMGFITMDLKRSRDEDTVGSFNLGLLNVSEDDRNQGLGRGIVVQALRIAENSGVQRGHTTANNEAFVRIARSLEDSGIIHDLKLTTPDGLELDVSSARERLANAHDKAADGWTRECWVSVDFLLK